MKAHLTTALALFAACGGDAADPTSEPIPAVTVDALYVVDGDDATISVIEAAADTVVGTIRLSDAAFPHHLYLSSDRREMYLAVPGVDLSQGHAGGHVHGDGERAFVMRLDAATGETLAVASLATSNHNAIPSPAGDTVWTAQMTQPGTVLVLDAASLDELGSVEVGDMPAEITFSSDGSRAFVANGGSSSVSAIDPATLEDLATIPVGDTPVGAWPGDDGLLYVDNETGQSISAIDPATLEVARTYELGFTPGFAATFADELWVTDTDAGRLVFLDRASGDLIDFVATGAGAHAIAIAPDGSRAWVTNQADDSVSVIDTASREVVATVSVGAAPNGIVYRRSP